MMTYNEHRLHLILVVFRDLDTIFKTIYQEVLTQFDKTVGLDHIKVLHISDSKKEKILGAHKDRHENFGFD